MTLVLFRKAMVAGHLRGATFVHPYMTRAPAAQLELPGAERSRRQAMPKVRVEPQIEAALPGATAAVEEVARRLFPGHTIHVRAVPAELARDHPSGTILFTPLTTGQAPRAPGEVRTPHAPAAQGRGGVTDLPIYLNLGIGATRTNIATTLLHELGHAVAMTRWRDAPAAVKAEILAQWEAEARPASLPRRDGRRDEVRPGAGHPSLRFSNASAIARAVMSATGDSTITGLRGDASRLGMTLDDYTETFSSHYFAPFHEWMAERFVEWCRTSTAPRTALERFFGSVMAAINTAFAAAFAMLGYPPREGGAFARFADQAWAGHLRQAQRTAGQAQPALL